MSFLSFSTVFSTIGALVSLRVLISLGLWIYRHFIRKGLNLPERYGKGSYVLITGVSPNSIGSSLALRFARLGFNLIFVSRTLPKMNEVKEEVKKSVPSVDIVLVTADLSQSLAKGFEDEIVKKISHLDVSIVFHNAGLMLVAYPFDEASPDYSRDLLVTNTAPIALLTQALAKRLSQRPNKSAFVFISSAGGLNSFISAALYSGTKGFVNNYASDYGGKIDVMLLTPMYISTNMTATDKEFTTAEIPAEDFTAAVVKQLGQETETMGDWRHEITWAFASSIPSFVVNKVQVEGSKKIFANRFKQPEYASHYKASAKKTD